jgi:hypothetical protein
MNNSSCPSTEEDQWYLKEISSKNFALFLIERIINESTHEAKIMPMVITAACSNRWRSYAQTSHQWYEQTNRQMLMVLITIAYSNKWLITPYYRRFFCEFQFHYKAMETQCTQAMEFIAGRNNISRNSERN